MLIRLSTRQSYLVSIPGSHSTFLLQNLRQMLWVTFVVLRDAVPQDLVREARRLINRRIGQEGIEPDRIAYYQQNYWFPE